jgi:hypothetical protein
VDPIRAQLAADHHVLDDLFARLLHDVRALSHRDLQIVWCELEHRLLAHMDVEEQLLWPLLEAGHRSALDCARGDHARIREAASTLGAAVELRTVRVSDLEALMRLLHHHAEREDAFLYRFACEQAPASVQFRMATMLRTAAHTAHIAAVKTTANRTGVHDASLPAAKLPSPSR